jgi:hypothetical protein
MANALAHLYSVSITTEKFYSIGSSINLPCQVGCVTFYQPENITNNIFNLDTQWSDIGLRSNKMCIVVVYVYTTILYITLLVEWM